MMQSVVLGGLFVAVAAGTDTVYVLVASTLAGSARQARDANGRALSDGSAASDEAAPFAALARSGRYLASASFIGLGLWTALTGHRARS